MLYLDILFIEAFVSQAILFTNRAFHMTVLHSALEFIEERIEEFTLKGRIGNEQAEVVPHSPRVIDMSFDDVDDDCDRSRVTNPKNLSIILDEHNENEDELFKMQTEEAH